MLIDTCGWVDFLRARDGALGDRVEHALATATAFMCSVSVTELLHGVKGARERQKLDLLLAHVPCLPVIDADWRVAGLALNALRNKGVHAPVTDALIASVARRHDLPVLTVDAHFGHLDVRLT